MIGEFLRIGDTVKVVVAEENLEWGYGRDIHGKTGKILSFGTIDYGYTRNFGKQPGIYENKSWANVEIDGNKHHVSCCFLVGLYLPADREREEGKRLSDLPETKFWPGDKVKYVGTCDWMLEESCLTIDSIDYQYIGQFCSDGVTPMPLNTLKLSSGGTTSARDEELELVERGNVYRYYHGEKVSFDTVAEEAVFYHAIGRTTEVKNPANNLYKWDQEGEYPKQALRAIHDRIGHGMNVTSGFFGCKPKVSVYRFLDEEVGERVRAETLKGFNYEPGEHAACSVH